MNGISHFSPFIPNEMDSVQLTVTIKGVPVIVDITVKEVHYPQSYMMKKKFHQLLVPDDINKISKISLKLGETKSPYLSSANALVISPLYDKKTKTLEFDLESFKGHLIELQIVSPTAIQYIFINETKISSGISESKKNNVFEINLRHTSELKRNHYSIKFQ